MMRYSTQTSEAADGRQLVSVIFEREGEEADTPALEVIFAAQETTGSPFGDTVHVLTFLSATRTDTREPVTLTGDERQAANRIAAEKITEEND